MITLDTEVIRIQNTLAHDLLRFVPELLLCFGIILSLAIKLFSAFEKIHTVPIASAICILALGIAASDWLGTDLFRGLIRMDQFANFFRILILATVTLVLILTRLTGVPDREDSADFTVLILGSALGMLLMVSANHLLMMFIAIEMTSLPSYVLAGFRKGQGRASEAALKYVIYGAVATGILLYGMSLLVGQFGTASIPELSTRITVSLASQPFDLPLATSLMMILFGLGYKLSLVPFHYWLPDVFEGALAEVAAILAIASKAAALALTIRIIFAFLIHYPIPHIRESAGVILGTLAIVTVTYGNLVALVQSNIQRLLAYSTIAHAGYLFMAVSCMNYPANSALLFYLVAYLPMTLGAFAVVAILRAHMKSPSIEEYRGLAARAPYVAIPLVIFLFSLLGLPPLAGFAGKFQIFAAVYRTADSQAFTVHPWLGTFYWIVLAAGVINTVIGAGYYLRLLKVIVLDDPAEKDENGHTRSITVSASAQIYLASLAIMVIAGGIFWDQILSFTNVAAYGLDR